MDITPAALRAYAEGDIENTVLAMVPGGIESQEAMGQKWLATASVLPRLIFGNDVSREELEEEWGMKFLHDKDDLFVNVNLPDGWAIVPQNRPSSYWSDLLDEHGSKRAQIFYKAAFYDRSAQMAVVTRFAIRSTHTPDGFWLAVFDHKIGTEAVVIGKCGAKEYHRTVEFYFLAKDWHQQNYPDYENPFAYWKE